MTSSNGYFDKRKPPWGALSAVLGLMAMAFAAGNFVGEWRARTGLESEVATLRERMAAHAMKDGHSKVIERLTVLETWRTLQSRQSYPIPHTELYREEIP